MAISPLLLILLITLGLLLAFRQTRPVGAGVVWLLIAVIIFISVTAYRSAIDSTTVVHLMEPLIPTAVNPEQATQLQDANKDIISQHQQSTSSFRFSPRLVRNILLPLPPVLPEVPATDFLQKRITAMEKAMDDMSRMLVSLMTERVKDNIPAKNEIILAAKSVDSGLVTTGPAEPPKPAKPRPVQIQSVSANNSPANITLADKSADKTVPGEIVETSAASAVQRPDWVGKPPRRVDNSYQMSVFTDPYTNRMECDAKIPEVLQAALDQFVEAYLGRPARDGVHLPPEKLRQLVVAEWEETLQLSMGPMTRVHLLLNFDQKAKDLITEALNLNEFTERAGIVGSVIMGVWLLLAVVWGYLKLDLATQGIYRKRLQAAAGFAILVIVTMSMLVLRSLA